MVPQAGEKIGPYEILGRLGSGGMGLVLSAWDARLHREVAIKILREEYASQDMRSRFLQEARAASGLNHPNICTIFDIGEQNGEPFLVMEMLNGETLRQRMNAGSFSVRELCRVARDVADALSVAHTRNIIHRDIKPANIFIVDKPGGGSMSKVLDFGLAKIEAYGTETTFDLTNTGTTVGTVSYMSPEQARGEALDTRSDLFSLGVVLYEMAAGRLPFQGATSALVFVELLSKAPDAIRPQNAAIPEDLERIILRLLEKDRTLRFQSAAEIIDAIEQVPHGGSATGRSAWSESVPAARPASGSVTATRAAMPLPPKRVQSSAVTPAADSAVLRAQPEPRPRGEGVLRPRPRVVGGDSSVYNRALRESSAIRSAANLPLAEPAPPVPEPAELSPVATPVAQPEATPSNMRVVPEPPAPSYDSDDSTPAVPTRPILPQSARASGQQTPPPGLSLPRISSPRPTPRFSRLEEVEIEEEDAPKEAANEDEPKSKTWAVAAVVLVLLIAGAVVWKLEQRAAPGGAAGASVIPLLLAPVSNPTGDTTLNGAFAAGLELELAQSPHFLVQGPAMMTAGLRLAGLGANAAPSPDNERQAARAVGATEILAAEMHDNGGSYTIGFRVLSVATGEELLHGEETAQSREQIPDAIDRLVIDLRTGSGEDNAALTRTVVPLAKEATGNLEALADYSVGSAALEHGDLTGAAAAFEHAASTAEPFAQAQLALAEIYREQHAQVASAAAAVAGQSAAQNASPHTQQMAAAAYALDATGNMDAVGGIVAPLLAQFPSSVRARIDQGVALNRKGKFSEAFNDLQGALQLEPANSVAITLSEIDLLGQERAEAARSMEASSPVPLKTGLSLLTAYLNNGEQGPVDTGTSATGLVALGETQAALMDATGRPQEGLQMWQAVAADAGTHPQLFSAAADALARAGLNRALLDNCAASATLLQEAQNYPLGPDAQFRVGLAAALCGQTGPARSSVDTLTRLNPQSFVVRAIDVPLLNGAIAWKSGDTEGALEALQSAKQYDNVAMTPFLRGMIHLKSGHPQEALLDFQFIVQHPGATVLINPLLYPLAQIGLARAYAASGDKLNSGMAYQKFLALWSDADPGNPLVAEARENATH